MASLDAYTELRLAAYPLVRDHFFNLAGIWSDDDAADIALSATEIRGKLTADPDNWDGLDGPPVSNFWSPGISSQGESLTTSKALGRAFKIPLFVPTAMPELLDDLDEHLYSFQPMVVGFKGPQHPTDTRYFIGSYHQQPPNRARRGNQPTSRLPVYCKSQWGFLVSPHTETEAATFSPTGKPDVLWAIELTSITSSSVVITLTPSGSIPSKLDGLAIVEGTQRMTLTWHGARPNRMLIVPSPPLRTYRAYSSETSLDRSITRDNFTWEGSLPNYLQPGQHFAVSATNATASIVWLENHARPA